MQDIARIIDEITKRGASFRLDNQKLRVTISDRSAEPEIRALLARWGGEIAAHLRKQGVGQESTLPVLEAPLAGSLDISSGQRRLWFLQQQDPLSTAHHVSMSWTGRGRIDVEALATTLSDIVDRHEALRTCFRFDRELLRCAPARRDLDLVEVLDLREPKVADPDLNRRTRSTDFFSKPFDLSWPEPLDVSGQGS